MHLSYSLDQLKIANLFRLIGASVVTLCELLDYIVMHCLASCRRRKKDEGDTNSSQVEFHHHDRLGNKIDFNHHDQLANKMAIYE